MAPDDPELRPRRSLLYMPASNPRAIQKARELACDGVILDLEDSVAPEAKPEARAAAMAAVAAGFEGREVVVRCNGLDTEWGAADIEAIALAGPDVMLAPKVSSPAEAHAYDRALAAAPERTRLWIMVETARAVAGIGEIVQTAATTRLAGLVIGPNDLALDLRLKASHARAALRPILSRVVVAARAHGLLAFGGAFNAMDDEAGLEAECAEEAGWGFDGKTLIHPRQIEIANAAFSPSPEEIARARAVVAAFSAPEAAGKGAIRLDGRMIERLHLKAAERLLATSGR
jgi:citrate lyase subunit beta/citryl-CoA lyase